MLNIARLPHYRLTLLSLALVVAGCKAPLNAPTAVTFNDTDQSATLGGEILLVPASTETDITVYRLRWGTGEGCTGVGEPIGDVVKGTTPLALTLPAGTQPPDGALQILAFSVNAFGESATCAFTQVTNSQSGEVAQAPNVDLDNPFNYANPVLPAFYDNAVLAGRNTPPNNPVTDVGATLGRVLFFDKMLSIDETLSCASCHVPVAGFSDPGQFSTGVFGQTGSMHAMRIANAAFYRGVSMFWDKRAPHLEAQATQPITNPIEMGFDESNGGIAALITRMQNSAYYPAMFEQVFGTPVITENRIQRALAQFERSIISTGSRWDDGYATTYNPTLPDRGISSPISSFSAQENEGLQLFMLPRAQGGAGCAGCHQPPTFSLAANSLSNGLDVGETRIFKSPSLKNIVQGMPMMHDGRFSTFEAVVAHYNRGITDGPALDNRLRDRNGAPLQLNLSESQQLSLVAFLKTLQDTRLAEDERFSDPFAEE